MGVASVEELARVGVSPRVRLVLAVVEEGADRWFDARLWQVSRDGCHLRPHQRGWRCRLSALPVLVGAFKVALSKCAPGIEAVAPVAEAGDPPLAPPLPRGSFHRGRVRRIALGLLGGAEALRLLREEGENGSAGPGSARREHGSGQA